MNAVISALARIAIVFDEEKIFSIHVDDPDQLVPRMPADISFLLGNVSDFQFMEDVIREEIVEQLIAVCDYEDSLELTLILLDKDLSDEIRGEAAIGLEQLLESGDVRIYIDNIFYTRPLPESADLPGAIRYSQLKQTIKVESLLRNIEKYQPTITNVWQAWGTIPVNCFGSEETKTQILNAAVKQGLFRKIVTLLSDKSDIVEYDVSNELKYLLRQRAFVEEWYNPLITLLVSLISYSLYWAQRDGKGIQMVAEWFHDVYHTGFPREVWVEDTEVHGTCITIRLRGGDVIWEGLDESPISIKPHRPIQPGEPRVFSEMLKLLDKVGGGQVRLLCQVAVVIQSRLWIARLCDDSIRRNVWKLFHDGPSTRKISFDIPDNWISQDEISRIFSPWITWQVLGDEAASTLSLLLPLGSAIFTPREFRLLVTRSDEVPDPDLVIRILTPLLHYCPWSNKLRSYLKPCLGSLVSRQYSTRMKDAAIQFQEAGQPEEARKFWLACLACYRMLVDKADLSLTDFWDLSHAALTLRNLGNYREAVHYAERFIKEWEKYEVDKFEKPLFEISELEWQGKVADAFRIYGLQLRWRGQREEAISYLKKALNYYYKVDRSFWTAKVAYELYKVTQEEWYWQEASMFARKATENKSYLPGGWLLRIELLLETEADFKQEVQVLYNEAYQNVGASWRDWLQLKYGVLLEDQFPWEAAEHWLKLIELIPFTDENRGLIVADQLLELMEQEPNLWEELVQPCLPLSLSERPTSLSTLWIWVHRDPDKVPPQVFQCFSPDVAQFSRSQLEILAEFCADRAAEEPIGSEERENWLRFSGKFNLPLEQYYPLEMGDDHKWDKVVWTRKVRLELLRDNVKEAENLLDRFPVQYERDPYIRFYSAEVAYRQKNFEEALRILEHLVEEGGTNPRVDQLDRLYRVCMCLEDLKRAEDVLNKILYLGYDDARALVALGHFKYRTEDLMEAAENYAKAIQTYIDRVDENESWAGGRQKQALKMAIRSLISLVREDRAIVIHNAKRLIESGDPELVEAFAEQLRLMGEFDSVWSDILRDVLKQRQMPTRRTPRAIAQYFMGRAIALALGLYKDNTLEAWVKTVYQEFKDDHDLLAEFIAGAKETYLKCLRQLIEHWVSSPVDEALEEASLGWLLKDKTFDCPYLWQNLLDFVITTKGSRTYYHDVREQLLYLPYFDETEFLEFVTAEILTLALEEARGIRGELEQFRNKTNSNSQIAAINIAEKVPAVRSLWLPDKIFNGDERPHNGYSKHTPLWVDQGPLRITSSGIFGTEGAKETRPKWEVLHDGSYSCSLKGNLGEPKQAVWEVAQKLLAKQNIWMNPRNDSLQIIFPPSATAIDITV
jgi:tetratricopeptide (TPR) repeat protein